MQQKSELPEGWVNISLLTAVGGDSNQIVGGPFGSNLKVDDYQQNGIPIIRLQNIGYREFIEKDIKFISSEKAEELKYHSFIKGDLVLAKLGTPIGKTCEIPEKYDWGIVVSDVVRIRIQNGIVYKNFLLQYLNSEISLNQLNKQVFGTTRPRVNLKEVRNLQVLLPPLPEQYRIVAAIETLFARLDATNERLDRVPEIMKHFRQAVLAAACDGRLTEDWRFNHISPKNLLLIGDTLPEDWSISKIKDVFEYWGGATPSTSNPLYWNGEIPWISSKDMKTWKISKGQKFITLQALENTSLRKCPVNSVLVVVRSGILLHTLPIAITESEVVINQDLKAFYNQDHDLNNWLAIFLKGKSHEILYNNRKDGTTVQSIKFDDLKNMDLLIPSKEEQKEIVRRLDALFAFADSVEAKVAVAKEKTEQLRRSILAKAFSGELVPTEAEIAKQEGRKYESAEMLLERIKKDL